jgi:hypothetical protein
MTVSGRHRTTKIGLLDGTFDLRSHDVGVMGEGWKLRVKGF